MGQGLTHSMTDKESTFQQQLDLAKNFAHTLTENSMTLVLMRKGKGGNDIGKGGKTNFIENYFR